MKLKSFMAMLLAAATMTCFTACDDDDLADAVTGTFNGYSDTSAAYFSSMFADGETLVITKSSSTTVDVVMTSTTWGTFTFTDAVVTKVSGVYYIAGEGSCEMSAHGATKTYDAIFEATIDGENDVYICSAPSVMGGTNVKFYVGEAPIGYYVADSYTGNLTVSMMGNVLIENSDYTVTIANGDDVTISIASITYEAMNMTIPAFSVEGVKVTKNADGSYTLALAETTATAGTYEVSVTDVAGTVSAEGKLTLSANVQVGAMPYAMAISFESAE